MAYQVRKRSDVEGVRGDSLRPPEWVTHKSARLHVKVQSKVVSGSKVSDQGTTAIKQKSMEL